MVDVSGIPRRRTPGDLGRQVREQGRQLEQQGSARRLESASIGNSAEGQVFLSSQGQRFVDADGVERISFRMEDGAANFEGPVSIQGPLTLRPGSIENDSLASPVEVGQVSFSQYGFGLDITDRRFAQGSIPVPAGFTKASVFLVCNVGCNNPNDDADYMYASAVVQGEPAREVFGYVASRNGSVAVTSAKSSILTDLSSGSITVGVDIHMQSRPIPAEPANRAYVEAQAIFFR